MVLSVILAIAFLASRRDGPIRAPSEILAALGPAVEDRGGVPLPVGGPTLCDGPTLQATDAVVDPTFRDTTVLICGHDAAGALGFFLNRELPALARPLFRIPGNVHLGGPLVPGRGALLHRSAQGVFWTTSRRTAGRVSRDPVPSAVVFGHARWAPDQLRAEVDAGMWLVLDEVALPGAAP